MDNFKMLKTSDLKNCEYNPRKVTPEKLELLKKSLNENPDFMEKRPLLVNMHKGRENIVFAGNQRFKAAVALGWKEIPAILCDYTLKKEKQINILDNQEYGEKDFSMFANLLSELDDGQFDMELLGLSQIEIENIMTWNKIDSEDKLPDVDLQGEVTGKRFYIVFSFENEKAWNKVYEKLGSSKSKVSGDTKKLINLINSNNDKS